MPYADVIESFPPELRGPVARLLDAIREDRAATRDDVREVRDTVAVLAEAQVRTEKRLEELAGTQAQMGKRLEELAEAQVRTEKRLEELAEAQVRTENHLAALADAQAQMGKRLEELAEAQVRTERRLAALADAQVQMGKRLEELAEAQVRTEKRLEELAGTQAQMGKRLEELVEAQVRTEKRLEELAAAQVRTEKRLAALADAQVEMGKRLEELAAAQVRTERRLEELAGTQARFERVFEVKLGGLGARWGLQSEAAFREGLRAILAEAGFEVDRFCERDEEGQVFGAPEQIELDVMVRDGKLLILELKSAADRAAVHLFDRKVDFYTRRTGRRPDRKILIAPYVEDAALAVARARGVEIFTDPQQVR